MLSFGFGAERLSVEGLDTELTCKSLPTKSVERLALVPWLPRLTL